MALKDQQLSLASEVSGQSSLASGGSDHYLLASGESDNLMALGIRKEMGISSLNHWLFLTIRIIINVSM